MADVIGRGVIEIAADARKLRAGINDAKKSLASLGQGQKEISASASRSIDNYIRKLQAQNQTFGKSVREAELFKLALRGASDEQLRMADSALRFRAAQERSLKTMELFTLRNLTAGAGVLVAGRAVVNTIDAYTKYSQTLQIASSSQSDYLKGLSDVRNIARESQASISSVGTLYSRVARATEDLGISQKQLSDVIATVSLALKASGATAPEAASAMIQLSQAFGRGTLQSEEFNSVSESAPRLMKALADGLGVPVGALKEMATQGKLTSEVLVTTLPKALEEIRREALRVQTISGAFTVLQNSVTEFLGQQAQSSNATKAVAGALSLLADNLDLVAAAIAGLLTYKFVEFLTSATKALGAKTAATLESYAATEADRRATVASVSAEVQKQQAIIGTATAQAASLQSTLAVLAADRERTLVQLQSAAATLRQTESMAALSGTVAANTAAQTAYSAALARTVSLSQLQANIAKELAAAEAALAAATTAAAKAQAAQTAAMAGATGVAGALRTVLGFLGGPIGAITTALSLGATAWVLWGDKAEESANKASRATRISSDEIVANLQRQIKKVRERIAIARLGAEGIKLVKEESEQSKRLVEIQAELVRLTKQAELSPQGVDEATRAKMTALAFEYTKIANEVRTLTGDLKTLDGLIGEEAGQKWLKALATPLEKMNEELKKAAAELKNSPESVREEVFKRIREKYEPKQRTSALPAREAKAELNFELEQIRSSGELIVNEFDRAQKLLEARRAATLVDDRRYYEERQAFLALVGGAQEDALQKEIDFLKRQTFTGRDAAIEQIRNQQRVLEAETKLEQLRRNLSVEREVLRIQEADGNRKLAQSYADARQESDLYIASLIRRNAAEVAGLGRGDKFRAEQAGLLELEEKFLEQRAKLQAERRKNEITQETFDTYLQIATETYQKEVELYKERTNLLKEANKNWLNGARDALNDYLETTRDIAGQTNRVFTNGLQGAEDALTELFSKGRLDAKSFIDGITADLNRAFVKQRITGPLSEAIGSGDFLGKVIGLFGGGGVKAEQAPAPVESRTIASAVSGGLTGAASSAIDATAFSAAVTTSGVQFSTAVTTSSASFLAEVISTATQFAATIVSAGAEFAASVAASGASGGGGSGEAVGGIASFASDILGSFDTGTPYVPETGIYQLHKGERVVTAQDNMSGMYGGRPSVNITQMFSPDTDRKTVAQAGVLAGREVQREMNRGTA